ncbi:MAG: hypothetical protein GEU99_07680 [Luteitalea sp.]|nr:hypothetical protein [Luteitalea sp.]
MLNYTECLRRLIGDVVGRVPALGHIDESRLLVFARLGRTGADGSIATCHCLTLPESEPGYYFWQDVETGRVLRRSVWFVAKTPAVIIGGQPVPYMLSFALPRFCDQRLASSPRKRVLYAGAQDWIAKLDTIVHELYHVDPSGTGLRMMNGGCRYHSAAFLDGVAQLVRAYMVSKPDPAVYDFLRYDFNELVARYGTVVGTTFRTSHPQRYLEVLPNQPAEPELDVVPLNVAPRRTQYTDADLALRRFSVIGCRRVPSSAASRAA